MHVINAEIEIDAPPERIWSLLIDFPSYPRWNPFIRAIEGELRVDASLKVLVQPPGAKGMEFRPTLLSAAPNRELRWKGKFLLPGLFDGEHYFTIEGRPEGGAIFRQGEIFSGILVPLFKHSLDGAIMQGFAAMNEALQREAELTPAESGA